MRTETTGVTLAFWVQIVVLVVGWMAAALLTRYGQTWEWSEATFGKWFLHHGLWLAALPVVWLTATVTLIRKGSRFSSFMMFVTGPALTLAIVALVLAAAASGLGSGVVIGVR